MTPIIGHKNSTCFCFNNVVLVLPITICLFYAQIYVINWPIIGTVTLCIAINDGTFNVGRKFQLILLIPEIPSPDYH